MPDTFTKIATVTVGSGGASSITFSSIPATYTDLCIKVSFRDTFTNIGNDINVSFNGVSTNRSGKYLFGSGTAISSGASAGIASGLGNSDGATASAFSNTEYYIPNYTSANNKSFSADSVTENNATAAYTMFNASLWASSSAITSITIGSLTYNLMQYSTATLYGIKNS
jgi:hypothetical protein